MTPLAAQAALALLTSAALAYVGTLAWRRAPAGDASLAGRMFALWWLGAALAVLLQGAHDALGLVGVLDRGVHEAVLYLTALPLSACLCGLLYYLTYVYTGSRRALVPLVAAYGAFFAFTTFTYASLGPWRVVATEWAVKLEPANPDPLLLMAFGAAFAVPALVAAAAYLRLWTRVPRGLQRYRVALVSAAFLGLFGVLLLGFTLGWQDREWYPLAYGAPSLVAALLVVAAFQPPAWVRRRLTRDARA